MHKLCENSEFRWMYAQIARGHVSAVVCVCHTRVVSSVREFGQEWSCRVLRTIAAVGRARQLQPSTVLFLIDTKCFFVVILIELYWQHSTFRDV